MSANTPVMPQTMGSPPLRLLDVAPDAPTHHRDQAGFKTTEFVVYLVAVAGVLIASNLVGEAAGRGDPFLVDNAWLYITLLTIGYMISLGLAKAGSRDDDA